MSTAIGLAPGRPVISTLRRNHELADTLKIVIPFLVITLAVLAAKPALLRVLFPATVCLCGYWLYKRNEYHYLSFAMWIVMLTPLVRRLVDYKSSYQLQSSGIAGATARHLAPHGRRAAQTCYVGTDGPNGYAADGQRCRLRCWHRTDQTP